MSVLISIKPKWCELITSEKKAIKGMAKIYKTYEDREESE